jgi:HK97 family phage prohead protease
MTSNELERRLIREPVALRAAGDGTAKIGGYALKFNKLSRNLGGWVEQIDPGSLSKSAGDGFPGVMARYNHEQLLGTIASGALRLNVDGTGLDYEVDLLDDVTSQRVRMLVERGDVTRSSFAAYMHESEWSQTPDGFPLRTVMAMSLVDVAPVDDPAYFDTSTGLRSLAEQRGMDVSEVEELAREDRLLEILSKPATVVDLGGTTDPGKEAQRETHAPAWLVTARRRIEIEEAD